MLTQLGRRDTTRSCAPGKKGHMTRRTCTAKQALEVAIQQGAVIPCYRCEIPFTLEEARERGAIEREHVHPLALGGTDEIENWAWSHKACHALQTNGPAHMGAGDKHGIAKAKRLARGGKTESKFKIYNRNDWPTGRKIHSSPFQTGQRQ